MQRQMIRALDAVRSPAVFRVLFGLLLMFAASSVMPERAHAANVTCSVNGSASISFGSSNTTTGVIGWLCSNYGAPSQPATLCLGMGTPSYPGTVDPFQPILNGPSPDGIKYDYYRDAAITDLWNQSNPLTQAGMVTPGNGVSVTGQFTYYAKIQSGQTPASGSYSGQIFNMVLGFIDNDGLCKSRTTTGTDDLTGVEFTLNVDSQTQAACTVTAQGPADLGSVPASATNVSGSTTISVTCPTGTPYNVGLAPSNGNVDGAGILAGSGGNPDTPAYELRSGSSTGPIWGDTASSDNLGNGVAGTGVGTPQDIPVYVNVPSANFRPDVYSDTVTIHVNY